MPDFKSYHSPQIHHHLKALSPCVKSFGIFLITRRQMRGAKGRRLARLGRGGNAAGDVVMVDQGHVFSLTIRTGGFKNTQGRIVTTGQAIFRIIRNDLMEPF